jgi:hypothetical protein
VPYDNAESLRVMRREPLSENLLANGSFERGRYWPSGWQFTDGLTTFWVHGGTDGQRCLRIYTDVLDAQWKRRQEQVRSALSAASREADGDPQSLPDDPRPAVPERIETQPPYYSTVAGLHGIHYRSDYVPVTPRAIYRFSIDARTEVADEPHEPKVFIKGFFDQRIATRDGVQTVRRNAWRAPMTLDPCDRQWRRYAGELHPWRSKSTLGGKPLKPELLQVQIYAYWRPGDYYFDNARLEIVGMDQPEPEEQHKEKRGPKPAGQPAPLDESGFPVFRP